MDTFFEQIVSKRKSFGEIFLQTGIWVFGIFIGVWALLFTYLNYHFVFMAVALVVLLMWVGDVLSLPFDEHCGSEYALTDGYYRSGQDHGQVQNAAVWSPSNAKMSSALAAIMPPLTKIFTMTKKVIAISGKPSDEQYFLTVRLAEQGHALIVITPNERVLGAIRQFLPGRVLHDADRA